MYDIFFRYFFLEKKIANFSKQSSRLVSLVIGAYWNPDLWKFWGNMGFKLTSVDLADGAKVSQLPRNHFFSSELTLDYYTLSQRKLFYCTFRKHANSEV